jgi:DNA polymerase-3 subunit delta
VIPTKKKLKKFLTPVYFDSPTDGKLLRWMEKHFAHHGVACPPDCAALLLSLVGKSMFVLASEMEKLSAFVKEAGRTAVTAEDVKYVTAAVFSPDTFALSNALLAGKGQDALAALAVLKFQRVEPTVILGEISALFVTLLSMRTMLDSGKNIAEIAKILDLHEYRAGLYARAVSGVSVLRLAHLLSLVGEADTALKSSYTGYMPLEKLIAGL